MLGELSVMIEDCEERLRKAYREREKYEVNMRGKVDRLQYYRTLDELNDKISMLQKELNSAKGEYNHVLRHGY